MTLYFLLTSKVDNPKNVDFFLWGTIPGAIRFGQFSAAAAPSYFSCGKINSCVIPNSLEDLGRFLICPETFWSLISYLHQNPLDLISFLPRTLQDLVCYLEPSGTSSAAPEPRPLSAPDPQPHQPSAPEPSGTSPAICPGTLQNLISHLHQPEPHQPSAPEPSGTSSAICTGTICPGTLRNLISNLPRNSPEPHQPSAPEPSGISSAICTGTLRNPPEPSGTFSGTCCSCTGSELFWAKEAIASFAVGEKHVKVFP